MKAQSKTIGMAIGVVLIIAIFTGVVLSSRGQAISSEISGNSEGGAALSLANTEDTEIIINEQCRVVLFQQRIAPMHNHGVCLAQADELLEVIER